MAPNAPNVTEAELAVLQVLWAMGLATIREIRDELYPEGGTSEYATVQKLLERLEDKALVRRSRRSVPHTFAARIDRDKLVGQRLTDLADKLCDGSMAPIVSHLVQRARLKPGEREQLRELIADVLGGSVSPTSPTSPTSQKPQKAKTTKTTKTKKTTKTTKKRGRRDG